MVFDFGPSSGLAEQIGNGAPADVFASASPTNMATVVQGGDAKTPQDFAKNSAEIAVPPDNPAGITQLRDLAKPGVKVAVCQPQVPCGKVAAEVFAKAGLTVKPVTEEVDVKSTLAKVTLGEVDAGVVYVTDVQAAGDKVKGIEIPPAQNASTTYPIATITHSKHEKEAKEFVDLVLSDAGTSVCRRRASRPREPTPAARRGRSASPPWWGRLLLVLPLVGLLVRAPWSAPARDRRAPGGRSTPSGSRW